MTGKDGRRRLTAEGAVFLAGEPTTLTFDYLRRDYPVKTRSTEPKKQASGTSADGASDLAAAWKLAGRMVAEDEGAPQRIADREAMLKEIERCPPSERSSREFMQLLWKDQRVLGDMGHGEYDLTTAIDDEQFRTRVAAALGTPLPGNHDERAKALEQVAENLMELAKPHTVRVGGSGKGDRPIARAASGSPILRAAIHSRMPQGARGTCMNNDENHELR